MKILRYSSALLALILLACPAPSIPKTPLPTDMSYAAAMVPIDGSAEVRTISVRLFKAPSAADYADYTFEPPSSKPAWLSISGTGTISGTVPTNASPSKTYTIRVTGRGTYAGSIQDIPFTLKVSSKEFNTLKAAGNNSPEGIWSDGTTMWVMDWIDAKIYGYSMSTKERTP